MAWNLLVLVSYGNSFSRLDLDGNKAAKGKCFTRKVRNKQVLSNNIEGRQFSFFEFKSALQGLAISVSSKLWCHAISSKKIQQWKA